MITTKPCLSLIRISVSSKWLPLYDISKQAHSLEILAFLHFHTHTHTLQQYLDGFQSRQNVINETLKEVPDLISSANINHLI